MENSTAPFIDVRDGEDLVHGERPQQYENRYDCWCLGEPVSKSSFKGQITLTTEINSQVVPSEMSLSNDGKAISWSLGLENINFNDTMVIPDNANATTRLRMLDEVKALDVAESYKEEIENCLTGDVFFLEDLISSSPLFDDNDKRNYFLKKAATVEGNKVEMVRLYAEIYDYVSHSDEAKKYPEDEEYIRHCFQGIDSYLSSRLAPPLWPQAGLWYEGYPGIPSIEPSLVFGDEKLVPAIGGLYTGSSDNDAPAFTNLASSLKKLDLDPVVPNNMTNIKVLKIPIFNNEQNKKISALKDKIDELEQYVHLVICQDPTMLMPTEFIKYLDGAYGDGKWVMAMADENSVLRQITLKEKKDWKISSKKIPSVRISSIADLT